MVLAVGLLEEMVSFTKSQRHFADNCSLIGSLVSFMDPLRTVLWSVRMPQGRF